MVQPMVAMADVSVERPPVDEQPSLEEKKECPLYGCPFLPQDIFYDTLVRVALENLRSQTKKAHKVVEILETSGNEKMATLTLMGNKGGPPESQINQDRAFVLSPFRVGDGTEADDGTTCRLLGVFDGHAPLGEHVSEYVVKELPRLLAQKLELVTDQESTKAALVETFIEMDKTVPAHKSGGCTASVILQMGRKVYVANAGDSRSFIAVYHKQSRKTQVVYVSREDKPDLPEERKRVESVGGQVYISSRGGTSRVLYTDPMTGYQSGLAMSRSIGDWEAGKVGVIPDPIVDVIDIPDLVTAEGNMCVVIDENGDMNMEFCVGDQVDDVHIFAVSATDGMFDFLDPSTIAETIAPSLFDEDGPHPLTACENLISAAASGWQHAKQGRYRDDIAIAVSTIRIPPPRVSLAQ
jgi:serine/threonine protein phosphatase PrpC